MKRLLVVAALVAAVVVAFAGCAGDGPLACTEEARSGLSVTVRDSVSGAPITEGAEVVATDGTYADTARSSLIASGVYALAVERPGTYQVTVDHPAYRRWLRSGVTVTADECHVQTVSLLARLQRP